MRFVVWGCRLIVASMILAGCAADELPSLASTQTIPAPTTAPPAPASTTFSTPEPLPLDGPASLAFASEDDPYRVYYVAPFLPGVDLQERAVAYLIASAKSLDHLYIAGTSTPRFEMPFGLPPSAGVALITVVPGDGEAPWPQPYTPLLPAECVGFGPDIDGDYLLDDCDPYPTDGPLVASLGRPVINPDITLESWNDERATRRLRPLTLPDERVDITADMERWCALDASEARFQRLTSVPADFDLTSEAQARLVELGDTLDVLEFEYEQATGNVAEAMDYWLLWDVGVADAWLAAQNELLAHLSPTVFGPVSCDRQS